MSKVDLVDEMHLMHPAFDRPEYKRVLPSDSNVDSAGYRSIHQMVKSFQNAGIQLQAFRAAEYSGDLSVNPLHANYVDPVDRDSAIQDAIERGKRAREDFGVARRAALDRKAKMRDDEVMRIADAIQRRRDALSSKTEVVSSESAPIA